jgi:two-component system sensor histidine kinase KdpD
MIGMPALLVVATTTALLALNPLLPPNLIWLAYLLPVVLATVRWGFAGAAAALVIAGLAGDFFCTQPYYSLYMEHPRDVAALLLFLLAGFGSALVITRGTQANHSELKSTSALYQLLFELLKYQTSRDVVARFTQWISVVARGRETFIGAQSVDPQPALVPDEIHRIAIEMCGAKSDGVRTITTAANKRLFLMQLRLEHAIHGTLAVETERDANDRRIIEAAITGAAMRFSDLAHGETLTAAADHFSGAEFSHRWRSSLTTILGAASVLQMRAQPEATRGEHTLLGDIVDEAAHLSRLLRNAFSALRATVHAANSCRDLIDPTDLLALTLDQSAPNSSAVVIKTTIEKDLPLIEIDPALFAENRGQLLTDEFRSSPPKSTIKVDVHRAEKDVTISISREPCREAADEDGDRMMRREPRRQNPTYGSEIGMWVASSLVQAAGADIKAAPNTRRMGLSLNCVFPTDGPINRNWPKLLQGPGRPTEDIGFGVARGLRHSELKCIQKWLRRARSNCTPGCCAPGT